MPDRRKHRGQHPEDALLFAPEVHDTLRTAGGEYAWLLTRGYAVESALKLVGDRHNLAARQRMVIRRAACSDQALVGRASSKTSVSQTRGQRIGIDGYNLLITIEAALSGGVIFICRDGCYRDLASVHGTYRKVEETVPAVALIAEFLTSLGVSAVDWYLDRPVSNSGRLRALMDDVVVSRTPPEGGQGSWNIELADHPDAVLAGYPGPIATSDSAVLDRCRCWINLAAKIIDTRVPEATKVDLRV
jgi:hypothetical protein